MPDDARPFLKLIQSEAAAGDPTVQQTVLQLADWLEERGDPRAGWLRGLEVERVPAGWIVWPYIYDTEAAALQELARRVMEAMTRECDGPLCVMSGWRHVDFDCGRCHGDGWLLTEAEACVVCRGSGRSECECSGRGWRIKPTERERELGKMVARQTARRAR